MVANPALDYNYNTKYNIYLRCLIIENVDQKMIYLYYIITF